jgi:hypothetical protein
MAVIYKTKKHGGLLQSFEVPIADLASLEAQGISAVTGINTLVFMQHGEALQMLSLPVAVQQVLFGAGDEPPSTVATAKKMVQLAVKEILSQVSEPLAPQTASQTPPVVETPAFDINAGQGLPKTALSSAVALYQPVKGTSSASTYRVFCIREDGLKLACRLQGNTLSVRAEPAGGGFTEAQAASISSLGFGVNGQYASAHYSCTPDCPPERVLGSILLSAGGVSKTAVPVASILFGGA